MWLGSCRVRRETPARGDDVDTTASVRSRASVVETVRVRVVSPSATRPGGGSECIGQAVRVERVVVLGNGASGKSRFARELSEATGIPRVELDAIFWSSNLEAMPAERWRAMQRELACGSRWILDGDLGPYDALDVRLQRADTVVLFDVPTLVCAWRAVRRSRERLDFWRWLFTWRRRFRPEILDAIHAFAPAAELLMVRSRADRNRVVAHLSQRDGHR